MLYRILQNKETLKYRVIVGDEGRNYCDWVRCEALEQGDCHTPIKYFDSIEEAREYAMKFQDEYSKNDRFIEEFRL